MMMTPPQLLQFAKLSSEHPKHLRYAMVYGYAHSRGDTLGFPQCISYISFFCVFWLSSVTSVSTEKKNNISMDPVQLDL